MMKNNVKWHKDVEEQDYPAAKSYLSLILDEKSVQMYINNLKECPIVLFKAKDIFRASRLALLTDKNFHVKKDLKKIKSLESLYPILLVRDTKNGNVIIADGYHRLCAVYYLDEDAIIPCKIV